MEKEGESELSVQCECGVWEGHSRGILVSSAIWDLGLKQSSSGWVPVSFISNRICHSETVSMSVSE